MEEVTATQLMMGYMNGVMIISAAFFAVAGIIFAISLNRDIHIRINSTLLILSIAVGAAIIVKALSWFDSSNDSIKDIVRQLLFIQFGLWFIPAFILVVKMWQREGKKKEAVLMSKKSFVTQLHNQWKGLLWNLLGPTLISVILVFIWYYLWNKGTESLTQLMQAIMVATAVFIALPNTSELLKLPIISTLNDDEKKYRRRIILMIIPGILTFISALLWFATSNSVYCAIAVGFFLLQLSYLAVILGKQFTMLK